MLVGRSADSIDDGTLPFAFLFVVLFLLHSKRTN